MSIAQSQIVSTVAFSNSYFTEAVIGCLLNSQKTRPTGRDLFGTPDLELGIHNSKIKANRRQESALWLKRKRGTQKSKKIQISDFLLLLQEVTTKTTIHYKSKEKKTTHYINH